MRSGAVVTLLATSLSLLCLGSVASALPSHAAFRADRLCGSPRPGTAACLGERLISRSLTTTQLRANVRRQDREAAGGAKPEVTSTNVPGGLTPANLHAAYGLANESAGATTQVIGIVDAYNDPTVEADLGVYDAAFGLPACTTANGCFTRMNEQGKKSPLPGTNGEWASEISLDVQMAHAVCQNCRIVLVEAASTKWNDLGGAVNEAVKAGATIVSNSYGGAEGAGYGEIVTAYYSHPGVVVAVSSGDCGYYNQGCGGTAAANFPASAPTVVSVGGTSLTHTSSWTSTVWNDGGSGCSRQFTAPSWQSAVSGFSATACGSGRSVADVAAVGDPYTGVDVYDSTPANSGASTGWGVWGGTSAAAPIVAAEWALAGGAHGASNPASTLYGHLGGESLYDVISGSNGSCSGATSCRASSGFDGPTGVGSPLGLGAFALSGTPASTSVPTVSGVAEQGKTLTAGAGSWSPSATSLAYRWVLCNSAGAACALVSGATGPTLVPAASAVGGTIRVAVTPSDAIGGGTAAWSAPTSEIESSVPQVSGFSPATAVTGAKITISGHAFGSATQVHFGSIAATFTVRSAKQIEATVPSGAAAATITVITPTGKGVSAAKFSPTLSVTGESPGRAAAGATVTVKGVGFNTGSTVSFGGVAAASVTYVSATSLKAVVPAGAHTGLITVTNSSGVVGASSTAGSFVVA